MKLCKHVAGGTEKDIRYQLERMKSEPQAKSNNINDETLHSLNSGVWSTTYFLSRKNVIPTADES